VLVGVAEVGTTETEGETVVGVGVEEPPVAVPALPDEAGTRSERVVVNGMIAVDSEEMSEESAEKRDGSAVVSNVRVPNGRPLVLRYNEQGRERGGLGTHAGMPLGVLTSSEAATWATTKTDSVARVVSFMGELGRVEQEGVVICAYAAAERR